MNAASAGKHRHALSGLSFLAAFAKAFVRVLFDRSIAENACAQVALHEPPQAPAKLRAKTASLPFELH